MACLPQRRTRTANKAWHVAQCYILSASTL